MIISIQIVAGRILRILEVEITSIIWYELLFLVLISNSLQSSWPHLDQGTVVAGLLVDHVSSNTFHVELDLPSCAATLRSLSGLMGRIKVLLKLIILTRR